VRIIKSPSIMKISNTYNSSVIISMVLVLIGAGITDIGSICSAQEPTWTQLADMQNVRQGHSSGVLDGLIYVIGGVPHATYETHYNAMKSLEIYDPILNVWTSKAMMDTGRVQFPSCVFEGKIYAFGGGQSVYWDPLKSMEVYDPISDTWTTLEAELPIARMGHTATLVNDKIYIIGGTDSNDETALSEVNVYDPLTNTWDSDKAELPTPRLNLKAVELNGKIYTIGGHLGPQDGYLALTTVEAYDPANDTWTTKADMSRPRFFFAACVLNEKIYVFGGGKNCDNAWSSVEVYDPVTNTWKEENPFPNEWVMAAAAPFNEKIYVSGGTFQICPPSPVSVMYEYDPDPKVNIPDTDFLYALIEEGADTNGDGLISYEEAEAMISITVSKKGITDMTGIEAFVNLETLNCAGNRLTTLDLSKNILLKEVVTGYSIAWNSGPGNNLTNLDVSNNPELIKLDCSWNELTDLDVSNNAALEELNCEFNYIERLDLSGNPALIKLSCSVNPLDFLDVTKNTLLTELIAGHSSYIGHSVGPLENLDISNNVALKNLTLHAQYLSSLDVSNNTLLSVLKLHSTPISVLNLCSNSAIDSLWLFDMPLDTVFVWELPFPPSGVFIDTTSSPNVEFMDCSSIGIEEFNKSGVSIYPNPTDGKLTIETNQPGYHSIEISSLNGQFIYSEELEDTAHQIDLSSFQKGVYFITIRSKDYVTTKKIIKL